MFSVLSVYISDRVYHAANEVKLKGWFQWIDLKHSTDEIGGFGVVVLAIDQEVDYYIERRKRTRYHIMGYHGVIQ